MALASLGELERPALEARADSSSTAEEVEEVPVERQRRSRWTWASRALLRASAASGIEATGGPAFRPYIASWSF
jgi:hypothetical protein